MWLIKVTNDLVLVAALAHTTAPVMFSHSSARALADTHRNVPDDVLPLVKDNGGVIMIVFYTFVRMSLN